MFVGAGVVVYLLITLAIGWWAARRVQTAEDYLLAGRSLPFFLSAATVFATWFGAESILGVSSEVAREGLRGAVEDPLGAALCLILVGLIFARPLYQMRLLTFADLYRNAFGPRVETAAALMLAISYFGWIAGQFVALGLLGQLVFGLPIETGIIAGCLVVVSYTFWGGMWAIAWLDFIQNLVLIVGLALTFGLLAGQSDWSAAQVQLPPDFFNPLPKADWSDFLAWFAALITIGLGSIPQQDVFQRVMAARTEGVAVAASWAGGLLYLTVGLLPIAMAVMLRVQHPEVVGLGGGAEVNPQQTIPRYIMSHMPAPVALLFVGALISAILSTCSAAILAPAAVLAENLVAPMVGGLRGPRLLLVSRACVLVVAAVSLGLALAERNIHELVSASSALSLVSLFMPMLAAVWRWPVGMWAALLSMGAGLAVWLAASWTETETPPILLGWAASALGLLAGWIVERLRRA